MTDQTAFAEALQAAWPPGVAVADVARKLGLSREYLSRVRGGRELPSPLRLRRLGEALSLDGGTMTRLRLLRDTAAVERAITSGAKPE